LSETKCEIRLHAENNRQMIWIICSWESCWR